MRYFIIETQVTEPDSDGKTDVNLVTTPKYTFASALAFFYSRKSSQAIVTSGQGYSAFHEVLVDENLVTLEQYDITVPTKDPRGVEE